MIPIERPSVLFLLKEQCTYGGRPGTPAGLTNSARLVAEMLRENGFRAVARNVVDGNSIDRAVAEGRPQIVVLEALWVTPRKMAELVRLHPRVRFVLRIHSAWPFLAAEGTAIEWLREYPSEVRVAVNDKRVQADLFGALGLTSLWLPNFYPTQHPLLLLGTAERAALVIGSFGALRLLKNTLAQAVAAIEYAEQAGRRLLFCVNEPNADPQVLKNLRALFAGRGNARLHECGWLDHNEFLDIVRIQDAVMQVSFTETFCIVAADAVAVGTPLVTSPEVSWADPASMADPNDTRSMAKALNRALRPAWHHRDLRESNRSRLRAFSAKAREIWLITLPEISFQGHK